MSRAANELALRIEHVVQDLEQVERTMFRRRMSAEWELETITMRREIGAMKGLS